MTGPNFRIVRGQRPLRESGCIHPRQYLAGVAKTFVALGGQIHEDSEADEFCDSPQAVKASGQAVTCGDVVSRRTNRW